MIERDYVSLLEQTHTHAQNMLVNAYDAAQGFPVTAASHTDLWPGDAERWVGGYLAIGNANMAQGVMEAIGRSVSERGAVPHYMLGRRPFLWFDTKIVDRYVQKFSGNGLERAKSGAWITSTYAPATFGVAAGLLEKVGLELPANFGALELVRAETELTIERRNEDGLIVSKNPNELTNNAGVLAAKLKTEGSVVDLAVNASYKNTAHALAGLRGIDKKMKEYVLDDEEVANSAINALLDSEHEATERNKSVFSLESTQAAARLGLCGMLREKDLAAFFKGPSPYDKHPEATMPSFADAIELARLTAGSFSESRAFLRRAVAKLAVGPQTFTRYEGIRPSANIIANRAYRRQFWTPTAAEAARISIGMIDGI